jgi:heptosyltransferase-2
MHVAYALGTPLVAVFGSTSPELTGPLGETSVVLRQPVECSPCFQRECPVDFRCMNRITAEQAAAAVLKLYERTKVKPHEKRF